MEKISQTEMDRVLAEALTPPGLPADLQARVMAAVARDCGRDIEGMRRQLVLEHGRAVASLRRRSVRRCVEALILAVCVFLPVRLGIHPLSLWLAGLVGHASPVVAALLSLALAAAAMLSVWMPPDATRTA